MSDLISVIIPVHNHAHTFFCTTKSLVNQTYRPIEVIVVNDGSTDDFASVQKDVEQFLFSNKIEYKFLNQTNAGAPAARNRGFAQSKGEYVIFWDADTVAVPSMLTKMHWALNDNPTASYAYSQFSFGFKKIRSHIFDKQLLKKINFIDTTSLLRRADFPGFDESIKRFQDWDLWLTLLEKNKTGMLVPEVLYKKLVGVRRGISSWLPSLFYRLPFKIKRVKDYEAARDIIVKKHHLISS